MCKCSKARFKSRSHSALNWINREDEDRWNSRVLGDTLARRGEKLVQYLIALLFSSSVISECFGVVTASAAYRANHKLFIEISSPPERSSSPVISIPLDSLLLQLESMDKICGG
jgi:hypothetical protein